MIPGGTCFRDGLTLGIGDGSAVYLALQTVDHVYLIDIDESFVLVDSRGWIGPGSEMTNPSCSTRIPP